MNLRHCDGGRITTDFSVFTWYDSSICSAFSLAICFGPRRAEVESFEDRISIRRMMVTSFLRWISIRFHPVVRVERRTDFQFRRLRIYNESQYNRYLLYDKLLTAKIVSSILRINNNQFKYLKLFLFNSKYTFLKL